MYLQTDADWMCYQKQFLVVYGRLTTHSAFSLRTTRPFVVFFVVQYAFQRETIIVVAKQNNQNNIGCLTCSTVAKPEQTMCRGNTIVTTTIYPRQPLLLVTYLVSINHYANSKLPLSFAQHNFLESMQLLGHFVGEPQKPHANRVPVVQLPSNSNSGS